MKLLNYLAIVWIFPWCFAIADTSVRPLTSQEKIEALIEVVNQSNYRFIRNGKKHTGKEAAAHIKFKLGKAQNMFFFFGPKKKFTVEDFIEKIASKSSSTGKDYEIQTEKERMPMKKWLKMTLKKIENQATLE